MPKYIRFGGQLHSFPDGTTDGQIAVALRQESGLTPHGDKPTKSQDDPNSEPMPGGVVSDTLYGMGRSLSPTVSREDRNASVGGRGELAGKAIGAVGDAQRVALDTLGVGKPTERTEQTINLFAQPGKTPTENLAYAGSKIADTAKRAFREMQQPGGEWTSAAMLGPPVLAAKFTGSLLDSVDDGRDPAKESLVQQRQRYADAAKRVVEAKSKGMPVDPADRDLFAAAKAGVLPKAEIDPATGQIAEPLPWRPGGMAESVVRSIAKSPASLAETYMAPENAAIMAGTQGAMAATKLIPHPLARAAAQLALGAGITGYFAGDMAKGVGESAGRAVAGDFDQRAVEEELPGQIANAAFTAHLASTGAKPLAESIEGVRAQNLTARSRSDRADALATGNEKLAANIAAGRGRFDGMNHKEIAAVSSDRKAKAIAAEKAGQPLPADPLTRDASVDELTQIARSLYGDRPDMKVTVHENADTVPADLRGSEKTFKGVPALYDPKTNTVHFIRDRIGDAYDAATLGLHEKTHGTVDIPAHQVAGFAEPMMKTELKKLVEEGRLSPEDGQRLSALTGDAFVKAVKAAATGPNAPVKIAADEVMAQYGQMPTAEPGKFAQGMATLASKIPGVQLTQTDAMALAAKQRAARARPFQQNRPIELMGKIRESLAAGDKAGAAQTLDEIGRGLDAAVAADTAARQAMADARAAIDNGDSDGAMSALSRLLAADTPGVVEPPGPKVEEPVPAGPVRPPAADVDAMLAEQQANDAARAAADAEASRARSEAIRAEAAKAAAARAREREVQAQIQLDVKAKLAAEAKAKADRAVIEGAIGPEQAAGRDVAGEILDKNLIGSEQRQLKPQEATPELMDRLLASKGDRVSFFDTKSKKVLTGTIYSADKKKVAVEVDGGGKRLVARDDLRPAEPTVAQEPPVAPPAQQPTPEHRANIAPRKTILASKGDRVSFVDAQTKAPVEGVIYSTDKSRAAVKLDSGETRIVPRKDLTLVEAPVEAATPIADPHAAASEPTAGRQTRQIPNANPNTLAIGNIGMTPSTEGVIGTIHPHLTNGRDGIVGVVTRVAADGTPLDVVGADNGRYFVRDGKAVRFWEEGDNPERARAATEQAARASAAVAGPPVAPEPPVAPPAQQPVAEATAITPPPVDRRSHSEIQGQFEGRRWADLTDHERVARGYQNELSGLPGKRYWDDAIDTPEGRAQRPDAFFYDLDDFKMLNDRLSHEGVDKAVLPFLGDKIKEIWDRPEFRDSVSVAHRSGDEFTGRSPSKEVSDAFVNAVNESIRGAEFVFEHNGQKYYHKGLGGSHGTGPDIVAAETASKQSKAERRARGERVGYRDSELGLPPAGLEAGGDQIGREGVPGGTGAGELAAPPTKAPRGKAKKSAAASTEPDVLYGRAADAASAAASRGVYPGIVVIKDALKITDARAKALYDQLRTDGVIPTKRDFGKREQPTPTVAAAGAFALGDEVKFTSNKQEYVGKIDEVDGDSYHVVTDRGVFWKDGDRLTKTTARFSRPDKSKHEQLIHPILGDLVDLASAVMADPAKKIDSPEKLARAMTDEMGAGSTLIKEFEREAKTIFEQAKKAPEERDKAIASAREALDKKLKPAKELGVSEDERTRMIQEAVDRAREDAGIPGTKKDAETLASAYKLVDNLKPEGVEDLVVNRAKSTGGTLTDAETVAAKMVMQDADLNAAMMNDPKLFARRLAFFNAYRITGTEQARSFRQRRWDNVPAHERVKQALYEIFLTSGDKKPKNAQLDADRRLKDLRKFLQKELGVPDVESIPIEVLTDQKRMTDLVRDYSSRQANLGMKARTWFLNSLVSAFKTHAANLSGNVVNMGVEYMPLIGHRAIEARLNQLFRIDGIMPSDLKGMGAQMVRAQQMALADATNYLKTGKNNLEEAVYGADWVEQLRKQKRSFSGKAGAVIEGPTRLLGTEDAYFVSLMGHMEALAAARMFARREGLRVGSAEYNARVDSMMSDKKSRAWEKGMDRAEYLTFKDETGRWIRSMLAFRRAHPNMTYVFPFLTTPANLIARGTEFVPGVGLIGRGIYRDFKEWKSGANTEVASRYSRLAAAQLIGLGATLGIAATGASMFKDDNDEPFITGSEPPRKFDQGEKEARRRSLPAYTIVNPFDPGERLSYRRVDPIATSIGLSVDLIDIYREALKDKNFQRAMDKGKNAILGQLVDKPFLKGPSDWIDWFQDAPGAKFPAFEAAAGFYPRALQQIPAALDPYVREQKQYGADAEGEGQKQGGRMAKTWLYKATGLPSIPGIGQLVEPKVNLYGDTVRKTGSPLYRMTVPFDRYGEEGISPEGRAIDLKYLRAVDTLPEDVEQIPTESGPRAKLGANLVQMYPKDWAEMEGERGKFLLETARRAGLTLDPNRPLTPEQITILRELASAGSEVAKAKMAPRYIAR